MSTILSDYFLEKVGIKHSYRGFFVIQLFWVCHVLECCVSLRKGCLQHDSPIILFGHETLFIVTSYIIVLQRKICAHVLNKSIKVEINQVNGEDKTITVVFMKKLKFLQ